MTDRPRITGDWPSPDLLADYPNWENALGEEGIDGQDETTIRPSDDQSQIGEYVPFTAVDVWLADGRQSVGILEVGMNGVDGLNVFLGKEWYRLLRSVDQFDHFREWQPFVEEWLPENQRSPVLSLSDSNVFPLRFSSRIPYYATSSVIEATILPGGGEQSGN